MGDLKIRVGGAYRNVPTVPRVKVAGTWRQGMLLFQRINGVWQLMKQNYTQLLTVGTRPVGPSHPNYLDDVGYFENSYGAMSPNTLHGIKVTRVSVTNLSDGWPASKDEMTIRTNVDVGWAGITVEIHGYGKWNIPKIAGYTGLWQGKAPGSSAALRNRLNQGVPISLTPY